VPPELTRSPEVLAERMRERFADPARGRLVAEIDGELRGFCVFGASRDDEAGRVRERSTCFSSPHRLGGAGWVEGLVEQSLAELEEGASMR